MGKRTEKSKRRKLYLRRIIAVVKDVPCADCGDRFETDKMTFDHLPEFEKEGNINYFVRLKSRRRLLREMAKCDVVCRPCHDTREIGRGRMGQTVIEDIDPNYDFPGFRDCEDTDISI